MLSWVRTVDMSRHHQMRVVLVQGPRIVARPWLVAQAPASPDLAIAEILVYMTMVPAGVRCLHPGNASGDVRPQPAPVLPGPRADPLR